jgi:hypothetical protein
VFPAPPFFSVQRNPNGTEEKPMFAQTLVGVIALSATTSFIFPNDPAKATDPQPDPTVKQLQEQINTKITGINNNLAALKERTRMIDLRIDDIVGTMATTTQTDALKKQLDQLRIEVDALRAQVNNRPVTAGSSPIGANMPPPGPAGTLHVTNQNAFDTEVFVNGAPYIVPAHGSSEIVVPAGTFSYSVPSNMVGSRSRIMPAGKVFGITIHP